jgi:hypothetical protein
MIRYMVLIEHGVSWGAHAPDPGCIAVGKLVKKCGA